MVHINRNILLLFVASFLTATNAQNSYKIQEQKQIIAPKIEQTLAIIKPDAVQKKLAGDIIKLIEQNGFEIERMEKKQLKNTEAEQFYKEHKGKPFFNDLVTYMTSGPVIILTLKKENAVSDWRKLMGSTDPNKADVGTIRKMHGSSIQANAVHGSATPEEAKTELAFFWQS